ncbi:MAG TPA: serine hydrolase domain-containing protein [Ilumatobacteraceae bacterium]|nr:serine hydrolase domain-containing protein [Ilumatobacteraceae bacterium]
MSNTSTSPEAVGMSSTRLARIAPVMESYVTERGVVGISTMVARRGEVIHDERFGFQDKEAGIPMTPGTIFRIYSMTKPVVSTALMLLHEEGEFQLDQPVDQYLPAFGTTKVMADDGTLTDQARPMQIRDLLSHTSGLTYDFLADNPVAQLYRDARIMNDPTRPLDALIDELATIPLAFQPGTRWHYSVGIDVAARLIEVLSDQSLGDFLQQRLFGPLGMHDTGFGVADDQLHRVSAMYGLPDLLGEDYSAIELMEAAFGGFNERIDVSVTYPTSTPAVFQRGGLGLFSTAVDYMRFAQMLANGGRVDRADNGERLIGRKTLELMHSNHLAPELLPYELLGLPSPGMGFGLGSRVMLDVAQTAGPGSVGEYGWAGAAKTYFWVDPAEDLVGLFMSQYMTGMLLPERDLRSLVYQAIDD